ncbi:hypothetical protein [Solimonas marina]|uniref:Uncharacterized protein n=1 Tax=Solimonas marina TaxID=2714601 RepID=A0A970B4U0_9GAMM|nr:hypothetical protein [Solimonas marina]NKF22672.1 hypothetical protein [Solimonas marina]
MKAPARLRLLRFVLYFLGSDFFLFLYFALIRGKSVSYGQVAILSIAGALVIATGVTLFAFALEWRERQEDAKPTRRSGRMPSAEEEQHFKPKPDPIPDSASAPTTLPRAEK